MRCFFRAQHPMLLPQICGSTFVRVGRRFSIRNRFLIKRVVDLGARDRALGRFYVRRMGLGDGMCWVRMSWRSGAWVVVCGSYSA